MIVWVYTTLSFIYLLLPTNLTMKKIIFLITALASFTLQAQNDTRIIVKLNPGIKTDKAAFAQKHTGLPAIDAINSKYGYSAIKKLNSGKRSKSELFVATFPADVDKVGLFDELRKTGMVYFIENDAIGSAGGVKAVTSGPNDALYPRQWGLHNDGSFTMYPAVDGADIDMENAWAIEDGSSDIIVATMDSGLRLNHPEFEGRLWINTLEIADNGIDDDVNGYIDDINGWDFSLDDNDPTDDYGHGTNVTGIIAANGNNGEGYTGIDRHCKLMTLKGLNSTNQGFYTWWYDAITYAADNGANVINLSVGGNTYSSTLKEAIDYALDNGVVVVACMMNTNNNTSYYPAKFEGVIAVGATNPDDTRTSPFFWDPNSGSNYGSHISVVAPGNYIYGLSYLSDTDYESYWGGTSQATPAVAGIASLLLAQDPSRTPAQVKAILEATAEDQVGNPSEDTEGFDNYYGHGRVNAFAALQQALSLEEHTAAASLSVYPNPSEGTFTIDLKEYPAEVSVHNLLGQLILKKDIEAGENSISMKEKGMFIVSAKNSKGSTTCKIIIK